MRVIALSATEHESWTLTDLRRAAVVMGVEFEAVRWSDLSATVGDDQIIRAGDVVLNDADALLLRTVGAGSLDQIVFRMDVIHRLEAMGIAVVNPPRAIEIAVDKFLSLSLIREAGFNVPQTVTCQRIDDAMDAFKLMGRDVVVKPLFGAEGVGVQRVCDIDEARSVFECIESDQGVMYVQRFIDHGGSDLRLFVVGDRVIASMRRTSADWLTNCSRGAQGESVEPTDEQIAMALSAASACQTLVAGVDIVIDREGTHYVLEVNASPGWKYLVKATGVDVSREVLQFALSGSGEACHA